MRLRTRTLVLTMAPPSYSSILIIALACLSAPVQVRATSLTVTTLAGGGGSGHLGAGFDDGAAGVASFDSPTGVAFDPSSDTAYVADERNDAVRAVASDGTVTTLAGTGSRGFVNGAGDQASFKYPGGVAFNPSSKTVYVADQHNHAVRTVASDGTVATLAGGDGDGVDRFGSPGAGFDDGAGDQASFMGPHGVTFDPSSDTLYVADTDNNAIRTVASDGTVATLAGGDGDGVDFYGNPNGSGFDDGAGDQATFNGPFGITFDPDSDTVYVADTYNNAIRTVAFDGTVATLAGGLQGFVDGAGDQAYFNSPRGVAFDPSSNTLYVADSRNHAIRTVASDGTVATLAGGGGSGYGGSGFVDSADGEATFNYPMGVAVDPASKTVYVADTNNHAVRIIAGLPTTAPVPAPVPASSAMAFAPTSAPIKDAAGKAGPATIIVGAVMLLLVA